MKIPFTKSGIDIATVIYQIAFEYKIWRNEWVKKDRQYKISIILDEVFVEHHLTNKLLLKIDSILDIITVTSNVVASYKINFADHLINNDMNQILEISLVLYADISIFFKIDLRKDLNEAFSVDGLNFDPLKIEFVL